MIPLIETVIIIYSVFYIIVACWVRLGEKKIKPAGKEHFPNVSVIVCARNEEENLPRCLESLCNLNYPRDKLELIIVDDESDDRTLEIMKQFEKRDNAFRMLSTKGVPKNMPAKQRPMNLGVEVSNGDIILLTDADCVVSPGWVTAHVNAYSYETGIVGGITRIRKQGGIFAVLQDSEYITKHAVAMGCAGNNMPLSVMGTNLSFRKEAYDKCGGLKKLHLNIVEDMAIMNAIVQSGYKLGWAYGKESVVVSMPEKSFDSFIEQRKRWMREFGNLSQIGKKIIIMELIMGLMFFSSLVLFFLTGDYFTLSVNAISWLFGYYIILHNLPGVSLSDISVIPVMIFFQMIYSLFLLKSKMIGNKNVIWKDRVYSTKKI